MNNISPIYVDRFAKALKSRGVDLKRTALVELLSAALGYHNSGEFSSAAKRGELTPPPAQPIGTVALPDGQRLIIVTDQLANSPYGIDESFIEHVVAEERAELIGVTPYGHLAWLGDLAAQPLPELGTAAAPSSVGGSDYVAVRRDTLTSLVGAANNYADDLFTGLEDGTYDDDPGLADIRVAVKLAEQAAKGNPATITQSEGGTKKLRIWTASVDHRHGTNTYAAASCGEMMAELAGFCREYWSEIEDLVDDDIDTLTDAEIVETYFDAHETEYYETGTSDLEITGEILAQLGLPAQPNEAVAAGAKNGEDRSDPEISPIEKLEWLTDEFGNPIPLIGNDLNNDELSVLDRATMHSRYWGGRSCRVGFAVKHEDENYHVIEIKETWDWGDEEDIAQAEAEVSMKRFEKSLLDPVTCMGGALLFDSKPDDQQMTLYVLLPFHIAADAHSIDDYYAAVDYLINGRTESEGPRKQVFAEFRPQAWVNDYAVAVDPVGETKFDVTFDLLLLGHQAAMDLIEDDMDRDSLRYSDFAPTWVREHTGPFEVDIEHDDIDDLFTIIRPAKADPNEGGDKAD